MKNAMKNSAYQWQYRKDDLKYCPRCGSLFSLEDVHTPNHPQLVCHNCQFVFYLNPQLVVVAVVSHNSRILLLKRAEDPGKGRWALLAGYVERGEDPLAALRREALEETGLEIEIGRMIKVSSFPDAEMVQLIFEATASSDQITTNAESYAGRFFSWEEIPWQDIAFASTRETLKYLMNDARPSLAPRQR